VIRAKLIQSVAVCCGLFCALLTESFGETAPTIELRDLPLLFADDSGGAAKSGVVRTIHPARRRNAPVLEGQLPWEGSRVYLYGSVYHDAATGLFSMWYLGHPDVDENGTTAAVPGFRAGKGDMVLYATSKDGLSWERSKLGLHRFQGSTENNIVFDLHSPSVLFDPRDPDPARRYKMLGSLRGSYYAAISPDGLRWQSYPKAAIFKWQDNISLTRDPMTGDYLAFHRRPTEVRGFTRRVVWLSRSPDFKKWSEPEMVFAPDAEDDAWTAEPLQRTEVNNLSVFPHAAGFLGLPTIFRVLIPERRKSTLGPGQSPTDGTIEVQLITSADGRAWQRTEPRTPLIPRGQPGSFDAGTILGVGSTALDVGDETWVYYTGLTTSHGAPIPPKRSTIGRAEWRRHGFASLDAIGNGRVETKTLRLSAPSLIVNADASGGELRVGLLEANGQPIAGLALEDCEPLKSDATRWSARWKSNAAAPTDRPVRVVVTMKKSRLFSLSSETPKP
jgi:hypothetical protein